MLQHEPGWRKKPGMKAISEILNGEEVSLLQGITDWPWREKQGILTGVVKGSADSLSVSCLERGSEFIKTMHKHFQLWKLDVNWQAPSMRALQALTNSPVTVRVLHTLSFKPEKKSLSDLKEKQVWFISPLLILVLLWRSGVPPGCIPASHSQRS